MGLISILISSLLFDTNKPARVVNKLFPKLSSLSQTFCLIERKNYQVKLQYFVSKVKKIIPKNNFNNAGVRLFKKKDRLKFRPQARV